MGDEPTDGQVEKAQSSTSGFVLSRRLIRQRCHTAARSRSYAKWESDTTMISPWRRTGMDTAARILSRRLWMAEGGTTMIRKG
jgi:hypothetical protein